MAETPTPKPPETLQEMKEELTAIPPDAPVADTVQKVNVVVHSELPYAPASRFQPGKVKDIINRMLKERLGSLPAYDFEQAPAIAREIADAVKYEIRGCCPPSLSALHNLTNEIGEFNLRASTPTTGIPRILKFVSTNHRKK